MVGYVEEDQVNKFDQAHQVQPRWILFFKQRYKKRFHPNSGTRNLYL